jgi:hypothetical protein
MSEKLQQAISAAKNGQKTEAQVLLTQVLKENPNETQAWFLLGTLVDSEQKKVAYLGKVLALEPDHQMARKMLARLQIEEAVELDVEVETETETEMATEIDAEEDVIPAAPVVASLNTSDFLAQQKGGTLPVWLIEEEGLEVAEGVAAAEMEADEGMALSEDVTIPDWLQDEVPESWSEEALAVETALVVDDQPEKKAEIMREPKSTSKTIVDPNKKRQQSFLTGILYALIAVAALVFIIIIYLAWSTFF